MEKLSEFLNYLITGILAGKNRAVALHRGYGPFCYCA